MSKLREPSTFARSVIHARIMRKVRGSDLGWIRGLSYGFCGPPPETFLAHDKTVGQNGLRPLLYTPLRISPKSSLVNPPTL